MKLQRSVVEVAGSNVHRSRVNTYKCHWAEAVLQAGVGQNSSIEITTGHIWLQLLLLMGVQPDTGYSSIRNINCK